jgi:hypothetical protein
VDANGAERVLPGPGGETLADCTTYTNGGLITPGPTGYNFTIVAAEVHTGNDFGNFQPGVCPQDTLRASKITRVVDETGTSHGPAPVYLTVQAAYTGGRRAQRGHRPVQQDHGERGAEWRQGAGHHSVHERARLRPRPAKPVWTISSSKPLMIIGPDAVGGNVGWLINTGGHELKGLRATGASLYGIQVVGPTTRWPGTPSAGSPARPIAPGSGREQRQRPAGRDRLGQHGRRCQIVGSTNSFQGATVESNTGNGVSISGTNNTIKSNKANKNGGAGFLTTGAATGNKFSSNASNTSAQGGSKENAGPEYSFATPEVNQGSNKADNVTIPSAAKCPTLFSLGGICN